MTGANGGLGLEAARHFARLGAERVIVAVRSLEKGDAAKISIEESTSRKNVVDVWHLDLCSYDSVKEFAKRCEALPRIDAVVENAGVLTTKFELTEGSEKTITTNVYSTFLLALLLLPKLKETATQYNSRPHLVIVSSDVHFLTSLPERKTSGNILHELSDKGKARMSDRYFVSKLLEVFACREICATNAPQGYPVIINFVNPGLCYSGLTREVSIVATLMKFLLARTTEVGSRTLVHAAAAGDQTHGKYLSECQVKEVAPFVLSSEGAETQKRVWKELSEQLQEIQPGILQNF